MDCSGTVLSLHSLELPRLEALLELMYLAAYADGHIQETERLVLQQRVVEGSNGRLGEEVIRAMLDSMEKTLAQEGREARFESIRRRLGAPRMRAEALAMAAQILHADQRIDPQEAAWMVRAAHALEIPLEDAMRLLSTR
ncbi:MAG: tellurite resistance TerB family protein [Polyangiaceae bacterium]|nr:tellurite resistance TerB family protein [Polyangiaceae bacterium]